MSKLLVICGPTATGKTSLAIRLAKKFKGEIISADSRQAYKGMDIATGKDLAIIKKSKILVHLLDVVGPDEKFSAAKYHRLAWRAIKDIWRRKKLPIIVGGTGFYIKAIVDGIESLGIEPDWKLRRELENLEIRELVEKLKKLDPKKLNEMNQSDQNNPRRLIRAIEIATARGHPPSVLRHPTSYVLMIGLTAPNKIIYERIDKRVEKRIKQGAEDEIKRLLEKGYSWESSVLGETIGYQEWQPFFKGKATKKETVERWKFAEHAYARRQLTWFKKDERIRWFETTNSGFEKKVEKLVKGWYTKSNAAKN
jgi:tRNA dimethylallyltransferase